MQLSIYKRGYEMHFVAVALHFRLCFSELIRTTLNTKYKINLMELCIIVHLIFFSFVIMLSMSKGRIFSLCEYFNSINKISLIVVVVYSVFENEYSNNQISTEQFKSSFFKYYVQY